MNRLADIDNLVLDDLTKGIPGGVRAVRLGDIGRQGWNILREDVPLPIAILKDSALAGNGQWMRDFLQASHAHIAPHGKTTMSPQLFQRQLGDGAWAMTIATVAQLQVCRRFGISRIVMANQLVGRQAIRYVCEELRRDPQFDFYCLVDSIDGADLLAAAVREHQPGRPINVLLEGGIAGGRTGVRDLDTAVQVAQRIANHAPALALRGVEGFEGLIHGDDPREESRNVSAFLDFLIAIARACQTQGLFADGQVILTAGGSAFYDLVIEKFTAAGIDNAFILTRSGCYLTQDSGVYSKAYARVNARSGAAQSISGDLQPALEVWAYVQSRPEAQRVILTCGKRDAGHDEGLPVVRKWFRPGLHDAPLDCPSGYNLVAMNDQHAHVIVPQDTPWRVGDMVMLGVSHPCTTFDKWQILLLVDDKYDVTGAIRTFF